MAGEVSGVGNTPIRVLIADDHPMMLDALRDHLQRDPLIDVVGLARDGDEAIRLYQTHRPDVALVDYRLPRLTGAEVTKAILNIDPDAKVIILSAFDDQSLVAACIDAGAHGYLIKTILGPDMVREIHTVAKGGYCLDESATAQLINEFRSHRSVASDQRRSHFELSGREVEVLRLMAAGLSNREIAAQMSISHDTVKSYAERIYTKLDVSDRTAAVHVGIKRGLIS